jgi:hypothetical protein
MNRNARGPVVWIATVTLLLASAALAHDPPFTSAFDRARCTFSSTGSNPFFPLWPGHSVTLAGEEEDDGETVEIEAVVTVTAGTEIVDGVETRVVTEEESEDGELVEVSFNYFAECRQTGDVWYFGEHVDNYEGGVVVNHDGSWRAGENGAAAGVLMPGTPLLGARFYTEFAPGIAEDRSEITGVGGTVDTSVGTFTGVLSLLDTDALSPGAGDPKQYAPGVGLIVDEVLEVVEIEPADCVPDATTHCLQDGRFRVTVDWEDFSGGEGEAHAILASNESGEFWFFGPGNTELLVKVIDACAEATPRYWVFAAGLTNVGVTLTVEDTAAELEHEYENEVGTSFAPILDTTTFATCP